VTVSKNQEPKKATVSKNQEPKKATELIQAAMGILAQVKTTVRLANEAGARLSPLQKSIVRMEAINARKLIGKVRKKCTCSMSFLKKEIDGTVSGLAALCKSTNISMKTVEAVETKLKSVWKSVKAVARASKKLTKASKRLDRIQKNPNAKKGTRLWKDSPEGQKMLLESLVKKSRKRRKSRKKKNGSSYRQRIVKAFRNRLT